MPIRIITELAWHSLFARHLFLGGPDPSTLAAHEPEFTVMNYLLPLRTVMPMHCIEVPTSCPGVPEAVLTPRSTWSEPAAYDAQAAQLARMFADNFKTFEPSVDPEVRAAGPRVND